MPFFVSCALGLAALGQPALTGPPGAPHRPPTVVLFVGNSFFHGEFKPVLTYNAAAITDENYQPNRSAPRRPQQHSDEPWGGVPGIFKRLTDEAGLNYEVHLEAASGYTLQFHYDSARVLIGQPRWDKVVLHEQSTRPLPTRHGGQPARFFEDATRLEQAVHRANPAARVYLCQTWARADLTFPANQPYTGLPLDSMTRELHAAYYQQAVRNGHFAAVAPVGDAWLRAVRQGVALANPYAPETGKVDLWASDYFHPSRYGAYLSACVLVETIAGYDARRLGPHETAAAELGIAPAVAAQLQALAHEQVRQR